MADVELFHLDKVTLLCKTYGSPMHATTRTSEADAFSSTEKIMQTFCMPRDLITFLKDEAAARGSDFTGQVVRHLDGRRTWFGLLGAATALLEANRKALEMGCYEYLLHLLSQSSLDLRENGPGFDAPTTEGTRRR